MSSATASRTVSGAIARGQRLDALRGLPARADHGLEVALALAHAAHVGEDQVQRGVVRASAIDDADGRDPHALLEDLRRPAGQAARAHAADVAPVRAHHREDEELVRAAGARGEERGDHRHVVQVRAAGVGVVVQEDVARVDVVAELLADRAHRPADGHDVQRVVLALGHGHDLGVAVHEDAGEVLALVEDGRVRGAHEGDAHLAHDRDEGLAQTSSVMGSIMRRPSRSRIRLPCSSTSPAQPGGITVVAPNSSTMAGPARRARSGSRSRSHTGQLDGRAVEPDRAPLDERVVERGGRAPVAVRRGLGHEAERGQPRIDHLDGRRAVFVAVDALVLAVEGVLDGGEGWRLAEPGSTAMFSSKAWPR